MHLEPDAPWLLDASCEFAVIVGHQLESFRRSNSRNVFAVVAIQYSLIWHDTVVPEWNRADSKVRLEVYQGVLSAPCRDYSGTLSLSTQQQSPIEHNKGVAWLYIPTDTTELAPCLASSSNGRTVSAVF